MILTRRQREIWEYLNAYADSHGYAPTLEEIGAHFRAVFAGHRP